MRIKLIILCLMLLGCGKIPILSDFVPNPIDKNPGTNLPSHPDFYYYIQKFENRYGKSVKNISINFANDLEEKMGKKVAGVCYSWSFGKREIEIDPEIWDNSTDKQREQLIFHELGHCALNRDHNDESKDGCPISIMRSSMFNTNEIDNCYTPQYEYYMNELFN